jgi:4-cresol dehydrogenase (hydroxylating)
MDTNSISIGRDQTLVTGTIPEAIVEGLKVIVGAAHVLVDEPGRALHSRTTEPQSRRCGAVVYPGSAEEVSAIMRLAGQHGVPVWPFSRGNNWGYGTKNALEQGAIIVVLERMNRVLAVDSELAYAVIEPGVTQQQLYQHLCARYPHLMMDCTDSTPLGSVLGNAIERGYGYTPYGDHFGHLCGLDVVLPTGELVRTGGAGETCPTWGTHKWGSGPMLEGLFSQGNFGIVVKGGVWLHPKPQKLVLFTLDVERSEQLPVAVDGLRQLALAGTLQCHVHTANAFQTLSLLQKYPADLLARGARITEERLAELKARYGLPEWTAVGGIYGTANQVRASQRAIARGLRGAGRISFFDEGKVAQSAKLVGFWQRSQDRRLMAVAAKAIKAQVTSKDFALVALLPEMYGLLQGKPTWSVLKSAYFKSRLTPASDDLDPGRDQCGLTWLAPAVPMTGAHAERILGLVEPIFTAFDFNMSACLTMMNQRTMFLLLGIFFDQENVDERARAAHLYRKLYTTVAEHGYQHYRGGIPAWAANDNSDNSAKTLLGALKRALDPAGILAPGRYHIRHDGY